MQLEDQQKISASPAAVFAALNDPDILKDCIPGCQSLEKRSDTEMAATIALKIGPVKATFSGDVTLSNINPPKGYTITGQGKAGPAGHAKGGADVELVEDQDGTILKYKVNADVGGKIAQLGGRLIDSTAKKLAGQFFEKFAAIVESGSEAIVEEISTPSPQPAETSGSPEGPQKKSQAPIWLVAGLIAAAVLVYFLSQ